MAANKIDIHILQADTIFKALHYVCKNEDIDMPSELQEVFEVLAYQNPNDTQASDCIGIMDSLKDYIKTHEDYKEYFEMDQQE